MGDYEMTGTNMSEDYWVWLNHEGIKENKELMDLVAPFPPKELMIDVAAVDNIRDFSAHGVHIYKALLKSSPVPHLNYPNILDFGCGCARVSRLFKNSKSSVYCADIDQRHIEWIEGNLEFLNPVLTHTDKPLPYENDFFNCIFSISVFSHITESYHQKLLNELKRISTTDAYLLLSVHGERAMERVTTDENMFRLIGVQEDQLNQSIDSFYSGKYTFIPQDDCFLTNDTYQYGITFIPESYIREKWSADFEVIHIYPGIIHDWQDVVVLKKRG